MSWSANGTVFGGKLEYKAKTNVDEVDEHYSQFIAAEHAIVEVLHTGALGDEDADYVFSVSGHGNKGHHKVPGWSNDFVSINIHRIFEGDTK